MLVQLVDTTIDVLSGQWSVQLHCLLARLVQFICVSLVLCTAVAFVTFLQSQLFIISVVVDLLFWVLYLLFLSYVIRL